MKIISLKIEDSILEEIDRVYPKHRYSTRTEFIRDAIRKRLSEAERETILARIDTLRKNNKKKTSEKDLRLAREVLSKEFEEKLNL